ncbi:hypothetical protein KBC75_05485 [Candidatus Shapirobacteria bacterium]|nr:hypothetical protein [Candidatus Shapirobacteria bacterium]
MTKRLSREAVVEQPLVYVPDIRLIDPKNVEAFKKVERVTGISVTFFDEGSTYDASNPELKVPEGFKAISIKMIKDSTDPIRFWETYSWVTN